MTGLPNMLDTSGNADYSTPDPIDWSKTKCTSIYHVWDWSGSIPEGEPDFSTFCDCGRFEYWQLCFEPIAIGGTDGT